MDGTFKPYAVQAKLGTMPLLVTDVRRSYRWNVSKHGTPGEKGENVKKHGRQSITDSVTALCTVPETKKLVALGDKPRLIWTHPLLSPIDGTVEDIDIPATTGLYGYFQVTFNFVQSLDPATKATAKPKLSIPSAKKKALNIYDKLAGDLDDLDDIPTSAGRTFDDAAGAFGDAVGVTDDIFDDMITGDAGWQDLARGLDTLIETANTFVEAAREVESSIGGMADTIQTAPALLVQTVRTAVDDAKAAVGTVASFVTQGPSDLYGMMLDAGMAINEENIVALMQDNIIFDPLAIPAGATIQIPIPETVAV
jgi:hypothetical protein